MTIDELFEALPSRFEAAAATGMTKSIQWNITGAHAGVWAFEITDGVGRVVPGGVERPDTTFTVTDTTWVAIAEGRQDATKAFMMGKLKVSGDMMLALKVPEMFPAPIA